MAPQEGTRLVFFVSAGNYLADIEVILRDAAGKEIVNTTSTGPWLILDLDPGQYQEQATRNNGQSRSLVIQLTAGDQQFSITFPE